MTEIKNQEHVNMIINILCEKIQEKLVEDQTNIIQLLINQTFPLNLIDILIEKVESFHIAIQKIESMLMASLQDLHQIYEEQYQPQVPKDEGEMIVEKETSIYELVEHHYKAIYRVVFLFRLLAKLCQKYVLKELMAIAEVFITEVRDNEKCDYKSLLITENDNNDEKLKFLKTEFKSAYKIIANTFPNFTQLFGDYINI